MKKSPAFLTKFRRSIFAEYLPMLLIVLVFFAAALFITNRISPVTTDSENLQNKNKAIAETIKELEAQEPPRITGNETDEELRNNPYVKHIRTALNGYLGGSNKGVEEVVALGADGGCGLNDSDKAYYESKFFLYKIADNEFGGVQAYIVFVDKPDTIFWAWVYKLGEDGKYSLRGFCKTGPPDELKEEFTQTMKSIIERGEVRFVL